PRCPHPFPSGDQGLRARGSAALVVPGATDKVTAGERVEENGKANILVVDDRTEDIGALSAVLEPLGHNVLGGTSGKEALRQRLVQDFAGIRLHAQMPGLDGFEPATLIKERERTRHIPIIFVTGVSMDLPHVFRAYTAGAVDYILKPFDPDILRLKVSV